MSDKASLVRRLISTVGAVIWRTLLDTLRRHSVFAVLVGFCAIYTAKSMWYGDYFNPHLHPGIPNVPFWDFLAWDLVCYGGFILALSALENLASFWAVRIVTISVGAVIAFISVANAFWLANTGLQLNLSVLQAGVTRLQDTVPIIVKSVQVWGVALLVVCVVVVVGLPLLFRARWRKEAPHPPRHRWFAAGTAALLLVVGGLGLVLQGKPRISGWRLFASNLFVALAGDLGDPLLNEPPLRDLPRAPKNLLKADQPRSEKPPNVIIMMLEGVSYGVSSFGDPKADRTPFLKALSKKGISTRRMRAVVPHTTKSLFSFVCGAYPAMQSEHIETVDNYGMRCLPHLLSERGYVSALFQSADGGFEDRPRLAANMGFKHFVAWPQFDTPQLGYLAADDRVLVGPALSWASRQTGPYFLLLVTSSTHHNYDPPMTPQGDKVRHLPMQARYHWLVRYQDAVFRELYLKLKRSGLLDNTIIIAFGDHGEAFGEHGIYQHDNAFNEEGLLVPFVVYVSPKLRAREELRTPRVVDQNRTLLDLPPTVLDLAGIGYNETGFTGRSLLRSMPADSSHYFACWYDNACVGVVKGAHKHVLLPSARSWNSWNLLRDPGERDPKIEAEEDRQTIDHLRRWMVQRRYSTAAAIRTPKLLFKRWSCPADDYCSYLHPAEGSHKR
jgi:lipoteichoic acid synthase